MSAIEMSANPNSHPGPSKHVNTLRSVERSRPSAKGPSNDRILHTARIYTNSIMADAEKIEAAVSQEEVDAAKEEIEAADPGGEDEAKTEFEVTAEEVSILRAELACEFPDDYKYLR